MPTIKQQQAFKEVVENGGNVSKAMRKVGYSKETAKTPKKLTESKGWDELAEDFLSNETLLKKHKQLLNAISLEKLSFDYRTTDKEIKEVVRKMEGYKLLKIVNSRKYDMNKYAYVQAPDNLAQDKALDKAYKLKGSYAPEKTLNVNVEVSSEARNKSKKVISQFLQEK